MRPPVRIFSGIQPTGRKHLGNYIGAITQYVAGQERGDPAIYCIVDLHAITVAYDPAELRERLYDLDGAADRRGPGSRALHPLPPGRRAGAHRAALAAVARHPARRAQPHAPVPRQVGRAARARRPPACSSTRCCMAADVLAYRAARGAGGGGPARAPRADARRRRALQRALRRRRWWCPRRASPRSARASATCRSPRRKMSTTGATEQGTVLRARRARRDRDASSSARSPTRGPRSCARADKPGISNLIEILAVVRGVDAGGRRARVRRLALRRLQGRRGRGGRRVPGARARALRRAARRRGASSRRILAAGRREGAGDRRRRRSPTCASAMGVGPPAIRRPGA